MFTLAAVQVSLEQINYTTSEAAGTVTVCVVLEGRIERDVQVFIHTQNESALGTYDNILIIRL